MVWVNMILNPMKGHAATNCWSPSSRRGVNGSDFDYCHAPDKGYLSGVRTALCIRRGSRHYLALNVTPLRIMSLTQKVSALLEI